MGSFERVLSGRPARHAGEPWTGQPGGWQNAAHAAPAEPEDPMQNEAVQAMLGQALQQAGEVGYAEGRAQAEREFTAAIAAAQGMARTLETAVPRDVEMVARTIAELAVLISRRIIAAELRHDPAVLVAAIEAGLRQAAGASIVTVELHPSAVHAVEEAWTARHGNRHRGMSWSFTADPTLPLGGCRLRTEHGYVEAGFEDQLAEVAAALDMAIPGYITSALGPGPDAAAAASPSAGTAPVPELRPGQVAALTPGSLAVPDALEPAPDPALAAASAGLDDLDLDALASLGLDIGPDGIG